MPKSVDVSDERQPVCSGSLADHRIPEATDFASSRSEKVTFLARHLPEGLESGLRNYWYPVLQSGDLPSDKPIGFKVLGEELVAWRDRHGHPRVVRDHCPHRGVKMSLGRVLNGDLQCAYHGLRFNGHGRCTLIPWESEDSPLLDRISATAYPTEELGDWIWTYVGDTTKFPPPPLADVVPEELTRSDEFIIFRQPIFRSKHNWLQAIDGNDAFHAVMLHSESQAVADEAWTGGAVKRPQTPLADRRMQLIETPQGLRGIVLDPANKQIQHGHFIHGWRGERWTLPGLFSMPIRPTPNAQPYAVRVYQFAIDAMHTQSCRWIAMRARTDEERERCTRLWIDVIAPRQRKVLQEDFDILETIGEIAASRNQEHLLNADRDVVATRKMFADAWIAQLNGERPMPTKDALVVPI